MKRVLDSEPLPTPSEEGKVWSYWGLDSSMQSFSIDLVLCFCLLIQGLS